MNLRFFTTKIILVVLNDRALLGEDLNEQKEVKEEISKSRKQIEDSRLRLTKLRKDGFELVSNIRVAGDAREAARRTIEEDAKRHRYCKPSSFVFFVNFETSLLVDFTYFRCFFSFFFSRIYNVNTHQICI